MRLSRLGLWIEQLRVGKLKPLTQLIGIRIHKRIEARGSEAKVSNNVFVWHRTKTTSKSLHGLFAANCAPAYSRMRLFSLATLIIVLCTLLDIPTLWLSTRFYQIHLADSFLPSVLYTLAFVTFRQMVINKVGFGIAIEYAVLLAQTLDDRVIARQPDLAIALGTPPCDKRFVKNDERTGACTTALADACYSGFARWNPNMESKGCREEFGLPFTTVTGHFHRCHPTENFPYFALTACVRVSERIIRDYGMCPAMAFMISNCSQRFGLTEVIFKSRQDRI